MVRTIKATAIADQRIIYPYLLSSNDKRITKSLVLS